MDTAYIHKRKFSGVVVSDAMQATVVVQLSKKKLHPKVKRYTNVTKRFFADNPGNAAKLGDWVVIEETRPISKMKRWKVVEITKKVKVGEREEA